MSFRLIQTEVGCFPTVAEYTVKDGSNTFVVRQSAYREGSAYAVLTDGVCRVAVSVTHTGACVEYSPSYRLGEHFWQGPTCSGHSGEQVAHALACARDSGIPIPGNLRQV